MQFNTADDAAPSEADRLPFAAEAAGISLIRASGEDAYQFLHGQLTQKVQNLAGRTTLAGYCSPKGRLLALLRLWECEDASNGRTLTAALPSDMVEGFLKRIRMYVLRAKVVFEEIKPTPKMVVLIGDRGADALAGLGLKSPEPGFASNDKGFTLLGLESASPIKGFSAGGRRTLLVLPEGMTIAELPFTVSPAAWSTASSIAAGVPQVLPPTRELFVPQAVNLELVGGVSFNKGCYPGQEVVSRVQHIGQTNRRAAIGLADAEVAAPAGAPVYSKGEEAGRIIRSVALGGRTLVLFSATLEALSHDVTLSPEGKPLSIEPLPYRYRNVLNEPL